MRKSNHRRLAFGLAPLVAGLSGLFLYGMAGLASADPPPSGSEKTVKVTLFGFPDNDPANSDVIAHGDKPGTVHDRAGGTGTFQDPVTFASKEAAFPVGTRIYVPYLKKYFVHEDECASCGVADDDEGIDQIDLWAGGTKETKDETIACEEALTQEEAQVVVDPEDGLDVAQTPIFDSDSKACYEPGEDDRTSPTGTPTVSPTGTSTDDPIPTPSTTFVHLESNNSPSPDASPTTSKTSDACKDGPDSDECKKDPDSEYCKEHPDSEYCTKGD